MPVRVLGMYNTELTNEERIEIAQDVSVEIRSRFELSVFEMSLNDLNQNICVKMLKSEAAEDVLNAIAQSLSINYRTRYIFRSALASGSYTDNPFQKKTEIYHFEVVLI